MPTSLWPVKKGCVCTLKVYYQSESRLSFVLEFTDSDYNEAKSDPGDSGPSVPHAGG